MISLVCSVLVSCTPRPPGALNSCRVGLGEWFDRYLLLVCVCVLWTWSFAGESGVGVLILFLTCFSTLGLLVMDRNGLKGNE